MSSGWEDDDLLATAWENVGIGADEGLPDEVRFVVNVTRLVRVRLAQPSSDEQTPAVFFLRPVGPDGVSLRREPLLHNGMVALGGTCWFVSPVVTNAHGYELDEWDDDSVFDLAEKTLGVGTSIAVIFDPRPESPQLFLYPRGLGEPDEVKALRLDASNVTLSDVLAVVDNVHAQLLVTPGAQDAQGKLWKNQRQHIPVLKAEAVIQMYLRIGLQTAFPSCVVRREQHGIAGRLDLEIEEPVPGHQGALAPKAILELKVLRSYGSTGTSVSDQEIKDWVKDGVVQTIAYQKERDALEAALCCFDMRKSSSGEACFAHVQTLAKKGKIELRVWFLFNSAKAYQRAVVASYT
jgi:hypothetical protein